MNYDRLHVPLWVVAVLGFGFADTVTTAAGLHVGAAEVNPFLVGLTSEHGVVGLSGLKGAYLATFAGIYRVVPSPSDLAVPAAVGLVGVGIASWNMVMIYSVIA